MCAAGLAAITVRIAPSLNPYNYNMRQIYQPIVTSLVHGILRKTVALYILPTWLTNFRNRTTTCTCTAAAATTTKHLSACNCVRDKFLSRSTYCIHLFQIKYFYYWGQNTKSDLFNNHECGKTFRDQITHKV